MIIKAEFTEAKSLIDKCLEEIVFSRRNCVAFSHMNPYELSKETDKRLGKMDETKEEYKICLRRRK